MTLSAPFTVRVPAAASGKKVTGRRLPNGSSIIFVTDKDNTTPAASMSIAVGSHNDPIDFPGLAHFCEHMLFMGTEKYPSEDAYSNAVSRSGGYSNAWTASDHTCYYYTSSNDSYMEILEMFLDFFIAPSFNKSAVDREINAVHSEDEKNHSSDFWRLDELYRSLFVEEHPRFRYGNGNLTTLKHEPEAKGLSVHDALRAFFKQTYVAERSCLVLYSSFDPDALLAVVEPVLSKMQVGTPAPVSFLPKGTLSPLQPSAVGKWYNTITTRKERTLRVGWVLPYGRDHWREKPWLYVGHLLGHEVTGTPLAIFREKGWATDLVGGVSQEIDGDFRHAYVSVTLTDEGVKHALDIITIVYEFIETIRRQKEVPQWAFDETIEISHNSFELYELGSADTVASFLSNNGAKFGAEHAYTAPFLPLAVEEGGEEVKAAIRKESFDILNHFVVERSVVIFGAGSEEVYSSIASLKEGDAEGAPFFIGEPILDKETRFHGMKFSVTDLPAKYVAEKWSTASLSDPARKMEPLIALPKPNPFFSDDFKIHTPPAASKVPTVLSTKFGYGFVKRNEEHLMFTPKIKMIVNILLNGIHTCVTSSSEGVAHRFFVEIATKIMEEAAIDDLYYADLASLSLEIGRGTIGFLITAEGPSAVVPTFMTSILSKILTPSFMKQKEEMFERQKHKKIRSLESMAEGQPISLLYSVLQDTQKPHDPTFKERLAFGKKDSACSYDAYCKFIDGLFSAAAHVSPQTGESALVIGGGVRTEVLIDGNLESIEAAKPHLDAVDAVFEKAGFAAVSADKLAPFRNVVVPQCTITASAAVADDDESVDGNKIIACSDLYLMRFPPESETNVNAAAILQLFGGEASLSRQPLFTVLGNLISSHFFAALRTTEALGYIVQSSFSILSDREITMTFFAQSAIAGPFYLYSRMHAFIDAFGPQLLAKMDQSEVDKAVQGVMDSYRAKTTSVSKDGSQIFSDRLMVHGWDARDKQLAFLETNKVTVADLLELYNTFVANPQSQSSSSSKRRGMVLLMDSNKIKEDDTYAAALVSGAAVPLPAKKKEAEEPKKEAQSQQADGDDADEEEEAEEGAAKKEAELIMPTFEDQNTLVRFTPLNDRAEAFAVGRLIEVPLGLAEGMA